MIFQLLSGYTQQKTYYWRIAKLIGLLLLINVQLNIGQEIAEAKNSIDSQFREYTTVKNLNNGLTEYSQAEKVKSANSLCPAQLGAAIESVTNRPQFKRFSWGIVIQTLSSRTLYSRDAQKYFIPASNVKLLTTAAALHQLGSQYRIRTSIYGTDNNDLLVVGRGDPSLTDTQLRQLAQQLSDRGIRQVRQIIAADNYFQGYAVNPSWEWEDVQADYGAPVNSLIVNQNTVMLTLLPQQLNQKVRVVWANPIEATRWRIENEAVTVKPSESTSVNVSRNLTGAILKLTGQISVDSPPESVSLAVVDPLDNFLLHLRWALLAEGIKETAALSGKTQISDMPKSATFELAAVESPPLSQLLVETNQNSNNLYAEALLRTLGVNSNTSKSTATAEIGLAVVKETLTKLGVDPAGYVLADGSGLSRHNLVSPEAIAQTLSVMALSPLAPIYRASLSVAGINGTLQNRFRETAAEGILQGKTGTMSGVVALSGYLDSLNYEPLVFSIIVNESDQPAATIRQATDEIVLLLTRLRSC